MTDPRTLDSLNERFAVPGAIRFETGSGGLVRAAVATASCQGRLNDNVGRHHELAKGWLV